MVVVRSGMRLTPSRLNRIDAVKQTSETRLNTIALAADGELAGLQLDLGTWEIQAHIAMIGGTAGIAIKTQWSFTGSWNNPLRFVEGPTAGNTVAGNGAVTTQRSAYVTNADCVYGLAASGVYTWAFEWSKQIVVTAPGLMSLLWAPNASNANSGGVRQGSSLMAYPIST